MKSASATSHAEVPVFVPAAGDRLFGVLTQPTVAPLGCAAIVLPAGTSPLSTARNQVPVRICRDLAALGYHAMRIDYHGAGESTGTLEAISLGDPFIEDVMGAVQWLRQQGLNRFVFIGSCFGARTALAIAPQVEGMTGAILMSMPVADLGVGDRSGVDAALEWGFTTYLRKTLRLRTIRGLFDPHHRRVYARYVRAKWKMLVTRHGPGRRRPRDWRDLTSPKIIQAMQDIARRRVPVLMLYGVDDGYRQGFLQAREGELGRVLRSARQTVKYQTVPGQLHGFTRLEAQDLAITAVLDWSTELSHSLNRTSD